MPKWPETGGGSEPCERRDLGARLSNASRAPSSRASRGRIREFRPFFAGGAGLLGACSHFSDTLLAEDGKPRAEGRVRRRSRTGPCCPQVPEPAVSRGVERFAEPPGSGRSVTTEFPKGITPRIARDRRAAVSGTKPAANNRRTIVGWIGSKQTASAGCIGFAEPVS